MFKRNLAAGLLMGVAVVGLSLWSAPALAGNSPMAAHVKTMTALGVGETTAGCTIVGPNLELGQFPVFCANGHIVGSPDCTCTEYEGQLKGAFIGGKGTFTLDVVADKSGLPGSYITLPGLGAPPSTCYTASGLGLSIGSPSPLPALIFSVTGTFCPPVPGALPGGINGSMTILNPVLCPVFVEAGAFPTCRYPTATGGAVTTIQILPDGSARMNWNGETKLGTPAP
jgi:hypothetical protein